MYYHYLHVNELRMRQVKGDGNHALSRRSRASFTLTSAAAAMTESLFIPLLSITSTILLYTVIHMFTDIVGFSRSMRTGKSQFACTVIHDIYVCI